MGKRLYHGIVFCYIKDMKKIKKSTIQKEEIYTSLLIITLLISIISNQDVVNNINFMYYTILNILCGRLHNV